MKKQKGVFLSRSSLLTGLFFLLTVLLSAPPDTEGGDVRGRLKLESPPANNVTNKPGTSIPSLSPDLLVGDMSWSNPVKNGDRVGTTSILNISVGNRGKGAAGSCRLTVTCTRLSGGKCPEGIDKNYSIGPLGPGATTSMSWPDVSSNSWTAGKYRISVTADSGAQVHESDENNNTRTMDFSVGAGLALGQDKILPKQARRLKPGSANAINPQPEPPGKTNIIRPQTEPAGKINTINPQPEPPGKRLKLAKTAHTVPSVRPLKKISSGKGGLEKREPAAEKIREDAPISKLRLVGSEQMAAASIQGRIYGTVNGKNVPQLAGGCENVSVSFFSPEGTKVGAVAAFEGDGAHCRYEYHTTLDPTELRVGAWISGHIGDWAYHEDPVLPNATILKRTVNAELLSLTPAISAVQTPQVTLPGQCRGSQLKGKLQGRIDGKGPDEWFGCENISIQIMDYNGNELGTSQAISDGSGKDCRYCFEFPHPEYLAMRLPVFIGNYDIDWVIGGRQMDEQNGTKVATKNVELKEVRDLNSDQKPDLEIEFIRIADPEDSVDDIETSLHALDPADFIYRIHNRGVSRAKPFKVVLSFGDIPIVTNEHPALEPGKVYNGAQGWRHAVWPHILCNAPVKLTVDPDNRVAETNENNNVWTQTLHCPSESSPYDLRLVYRHHDIVEQSPMTPVRFLYTVTNEDRNEPATQGAPPSLLSIKVYKYSDGSLLGETDVDIPAIPLGSQYNGEFYAFVTDRSDYVVLYIDPDNNIPEKRIDNNRIRYNASHLRFVP